MRRKRGRGRTRRLRAGLVTPLPGGFGSRSGPTTGVRLEWLDAEGMKGGESCPIRAGEHRYLRARKHGSGD